MNRNNFQIDADVDRLVDNDVEKEEEEEENWWQLWEQRRRMAVAQVACYVVHAICLIRVYYDEQCDNDEEEAEEMARKRKVRTWERELKRIREAISEVSETIREGNKVVERARRRVYSEREVYAELVKIGVDKNLRYTAYTFLTQDPVRVRAFFGSPVCERKEFLLHMMYGPSPRG